MKTQLAAEQRIIGLSKFFPKKVKENLKWFVQPFWKNKYITFFLIHKTNC